MKETDITEKIWKIRRSSLVFCVTFLVLVLLCLTALKLVAYGLWRPLIEARTREAAFDMVMAHREGVREERKDDWLKAVNRSAPVFLRAASAPESVSLPERGKK